MYYEINPEYRYLEKEILSIPERFQREGEVIYIGRNLLKVLDVGGIKLCL